MGQSQINLRVDEGLRVQAERVFDSLGCSMSSAFTMFLRAVVRQRGISFLPLELAPEEITPQDWGAADTSTVVSWGYDDFVTELERRALSLPVDNNAEVSVHTIFAQADELQEIGRKKIGGSLGKHLFDNQERLGLRYIPESKNPAKYLKVEENETD